MSRRPNPLPWPCRWRTNLIQTPGFAVVTAVCGTVSLLVSLADKSGRAQHRIAQLWARALVWISGCSLTVRGAENLRKHAVAVYASNHTSYMDTPVIFAGLPFQFRILAKKELWPIAFIGWYLDRSGQIPIDTANPRASLSSLGQGPALRHASFCLSRGWAHLHRRLTPVPLRSSLPGHPRPGAAGAHRAQRGI